MNPLSKRAPPNRADAEAYIKALTGSVDSKVTFQTIQDCRAKSDDTHPGKILQGTLNQRWEELSRLNQEAGHGIYIMVNEGNLEGRKAENVTGIRAVFTDDDGKGARPFAFAPSFTVVSKKGPHHYYLIVPGERRERFSEVQKALAEACNTDSCISDLPRVMRLPGFDHLKDPDEPFRVLFQSGDERARHTFDEIMAKCPRNTSGLAKKHKMGGTVQNCVTDAETKIAAAKQWLVHQPTAIQGEHGDNRTFQICAAVRRGFNLSEDEGFEAVRDWNSRCSPSWSETDLRELLRNGYEYGIEEIGGRLPSGQIAYCVPLEKYIYKRSNGTWDTTAPIGPVSAKYHLSSTLKYPQDAADRILNPVNGQLTVAYGIDCEPTKPPTFERESRNFLNTYVPPQLIPREGDWTTVKRVLETVTSHDEAAFQYLFNWIAYKVQNPGCRNMTALVFQGTQGTGKSSVGRIVMTLLGKENCAQIGQNDLESKFNSTYADKLLVLADEVVNSSNARNLDSTLKKLITDPTLYVNAKNVKQYPVTNRTSLIFTSNSAKPLHIDPNGDRRNSVFRNVEKQTPDDIQMWTKVYGPDGEFSHTFMAELEAFAFDVKNHVVDLNLIRRPFENEARRDLAEASMSSVQAFCQAVDERGVDGILSDAKRDLSLNIDVPRPEQCWAGDELLAEPFYATYRAFCATNGFEQPVSKPRFTAEIAAHRPDWKKNKQKSGSRRWVYTGPKKQSDSEVSVPDTYPPVLGFAQLTSPDFQRSCEPGTNTVLPTAFASGEQGLRGGE